MIRSREVPKHPDEDVERVWIVEHNEGETRVVATRTATGPSAPLDVRRAITTHGRSEVQRYLDVKLTPPDKITLSDLGIFPPFPE